ncbi:MAG TPA: hypothetical protein VJ023_10290 [Pyrinomonadaceae bacterium]|nr:hypothetical protein [Pyrinomonadaceae bacterium]
MDSISYKITVGGWSVDSADDPKTELLALDVRLGMNSTHDSARLAVYAPPAPQPGLLEQVVGAAAGALGLGGEEEESFSVQVRGNPIKHGDTLTIELAAGDRSGKVITTEVQSIESSLGQTTIVGSTSKRKIAGVRINQIYENQSLDQIIKDLASQAGINTGDIATGSSYSYLVADESRSVLKQIVDLATRDGMDVYFDPDNKLTLKKFEKSSADHTLYYGIDILDLRMTNTKPPADRVVVYGESPSSNQGSSTWHWLAKDLSSFRAELGEGVSTFAIEDVALRTKDAADSLATSKLGALKDRAARGKLKVMGNPELKLGNAIEIKNAPKPELNGLFKVTAVRHVLDKRSGYLTWVDFSGQGGAAAAGGLMGQLAGALGL